MIKTYRDKKVVGVFIFIALVIIEPRMRGFMHDLLTYRMRKMLKSNRIYQIKEAINGAKSLGD
jgi:hypothetical protein